MAVKNAFVSYIKRQRRKYTSAVPLLFRDFPALNLRFIGRTRCILLPFGFDALLRGDMKEHRLLPCTNRQLSDDA